MLRVQFSRWFTLEFRLMLRFLAKAQATSNTKIQVCISRGHDVWLHNPNDSDMQLNPGELFGFGLAHATESPIGWKFLQPPNRTVKPPLCC